MNDREAKSIIEGLPASARSALSVPAEEWPEALERCMDATRADSELYDQLYALDSWTRSMRPEELRALALSAGFYLPAKPVKLKTDLEKLADEHAAAWACEFEDGRHSVRGCGPKDFNAWVRAKRATDAKTVAAPAPPAPPAAPPAARQEAEAADFIEAAREYAKARRVSMTRAMSAVAAADPVGHRVWLNTQKK